MANPPHHQSGPHQRAPNINTNQSTAAGTNSNSNHSRYNNNYSNHPRGAFQAPNMYAPQMPNIQYQPQYVSAIQYGAPHHAHYVQPHNMMSYYNTTPAMLSHISPGSGTNIPTSGIDQSSNTAPSTAQLSSVPPLNPLKPREKNPAILKDPTTKEVVVLDALVNPPVGKEQTPITNDISGNATTHASDHNKANKYSTSPTNNDNNKQSSTIAQEFSARVVQRVLESEKDENEKDLINKNSSTVKTKSELTSSIEPHPDNDDKTDTVDQTKLDSSKALEQSLPETLVKEEKTAPAPLPDSNTTTDTDNATKNSERASDAVDSTTTDAPTKSSEKIDSGDNACKSDPQDIQKSTELEQKEIVKKDSGEEEKEVEEEEAKGEADSIEQPSLKDDKVDDVSAQPKPELNYEPDQYNPKTNPNGKRRYTCEFMRQILDRLGLVTVKPANHNHGSNKLVQQDLFAVSFGNQTRNFPSTRQIDPIRRQSQHAYPGRSSMGQEKQRKVISSVSLTQEVELRTTSSPWKPMKEATKEGVPDEELETMKLLKQFRGILNKLTPNNFEQLSKSVKDLPINTENRLEQIIGIVFEKAIAEPGFCSLYGRMCSLLKSDQVKGANGEAKFGHVLLKKCQERFQADVYAGLDIDGRNKAIDEETDPIVKKRLQEELYDDMFLCRLRGLGLQKFIGELYKINMLNEIIMIECILSLVRDASEESLECLCDLLKTIGKKLEDSLEATTQEAVQSKASGKHTTKGTSLASVVAGKKDKNHQSNLEDLDFVFSQLNVLRKNKDKNLSTRIRFRIQDTIDLRQQKWLPRRVENNPKLIEDVRREAKEEDQKADLRSNSRNSNKPRGLPGVQSFPSGMGNSNSRTQPSNQESSKNHQEDAKNVVSMLQNLKQPERDTKLGPGWLLNKKPISRNPTAASVAPKAADLT